MLSPDQKILSTPHCWDHCHHHYMALPLPLPSRGIAIAITITWHCHSHHNMANYKMCPRLPKSKSSPLTPIQLDGENAGKKFAFPKLKIQFGADETQVGLLPSQTSEVAEVTNFIVAGSHEK